MDKFKVGDKVRAINCNTVSDIGEFISDLKGKVCTIVGRKSCITYKYVTSDGTLSDTFGDHNLELVEELPRKIYNFFQVMATLNENLIAKRIPDGQVMFKCGEKLYWDLDGKRIANEDLAVTCHDKNISSQFCIEEDTVIKIGDNIDIDTQGGLTLHGTLVRRHNNQDYVLVKVRPSMVTRSRS